MSGRQTHDGGHEEVGAGRARRLLLVVGARPNFVKAGPVYHAARADSRLAVRLVHTGQHYDANLSASFFEELGLPQPDVSLGVGSGSHAEQTAEVMRRLEPVLIDERPDCMVLFGDVNSTLAAAVTAAKLQLPIAHVEAGLRSFDASMPEEINRRVTDCLSDLLFTTEASGNDNLAREGVPAERVHFVGNTMVDSLLGQIKRARRRLPQVLERFALTAGGYGLLTLHRPANVDDDATFAGLMGAVAKIAHRLPIVFPVHPRTDRLLAGTQGLPDALIRCPPLPYLDFVGLMDGARLVLTDSGGIQEETTALGKPCLTLRSNTERPVTVTDGTNRLVGADPTAIIDAAEAILDGGEQPAPEPPPLWDGRAAERVTRVLAEADLAGAGSGR